MTIQTPLISPLPEIKVPPTVFEELLCGTIFSGMGGATLGLHDANYKEKFAIDWEEHAGECFKNNFESVLFFLMDVRKVTPKFIYDKTGVGPGDLHLLQISPPCVMVSMTGKRILLHSINALYFHALWLINFLLPKSFVIETVPGMAIGEMQILLSMIVSVLRELPYEFIIFKQSSAIFGAPQNRERLFIVGYHKNFGKKPTIPQPKPDWKPVTIADVLPEVEYIVTDNYGRRVINNASPVSTITSHPDMKKSVGGKLYPMEPRDFARLSTIPDSYILSGSRTEQIKRIGNIVIPAHMKAIAENIKQQLFINN